MMVMVMMRNDDDDDGDGDGDDDDNNDKCTPGICVGSLYQPSSHIQPTIKQADTDESLAASPLNHQSANKPNNQAQHHYWCKRPPYQPSNQALRTEAAFLKLAQWNLKAQKWKRLFDIKAENRKFLVEMKVISIATIHQDPCRRFTALYLLSKHPPDKL